MTKENNKCKRCGDCCREMFFLVDRASTPDGLDHLEWAGLHGVRIEYRDGPRNERWWGVALDKPCSKLQRNERGCTCAIYEERPLMCRKYSCGARQHKARRST